ncbi:MAG TPA: hypothetical protein PKG81_06670 [Candidatus Omnitrophota bacterium]|nr:hypothetical protein [Candidatus Omnitrophota bacterium]
MKNKIKIFFVAAAVVLLMFFTFKLLFIRTVNYEIAGVKIPSTYNILTGNVNPIPNYKGKTDLPSIEPRITKAIGLSNDDLTKAHFRYALFAQWVSTHPEYKGWDTDKGISDKAHEAFKEDMKKFKGSVVVL